MTEGKPLRHAGIRLPRLRRMQSENMKLFEGLVIGNALFRGHMPRVWTRGNQRRGRRETLGIL